MNQNGRNWLTSLPVVLLCVSTILNAYFLLALRNRPNPAATEKEYSWIGDDHPHTLPIDLSDTFEHVYTEHIDYFGIVDDVKSNTVWGTLHPPGIGYLHLGPNKRPFGLSMIHQIHCLMTIRHVIQTGADPQGPWHLGHCLNYLLQGVLCASDVTLEPSVDEERVVGGVPIITPQLSPNATHVCRDWTRVYKYIDEEFWKNSNTSLLFQ